MIEILLITFVFTNQYPLSLTYRILWQRAVCFLPWYPSCNDNPEWPSAASPAESSVVSFQREENCGGDQTESTLAEAGWTRIIVTLHVNWMWSEKVIKHFSIAVLIRFTSRYWQELHNTMCIMIHGSWSSYIIIYCNRYDAYCHILW